MSPEEAIKELLAMPHGYDLYITQNRRKALNLATSALQAFLFARHGGSWDPQALLPGETREKLAISIPRSVTLRSGGADKIE